MTMSVQKYKKLYRIEADSINYLSKDILSKVILQGSKNWDFYLSVSDNEYDFEVLKNIEILEFENEKNMMNYMSKLSEELFIDYSIEHNGFHVVNYEKN